MPPVEEVKGKGLPKGTTQWSAATTAQSVQPLDGVLNSRSHGQDQPPEVGSGGLGETTPPEEKNATKTARDAADGNHAALLPMSLSVSVQRSYRPEASQLFHPAPNHDKDRSV